MKKIILSIVLLITSICSFAQVNPKVEKLREQLRSNGRDIGVTYEYGDDVTVRYNMFNRLYSEPETIAPKWLNKQAKTGEVLHEITLRTLEELESDAAEYYCYQNNIEGQDTCYYSMAFGDFGKTYKVVRQNVKNPWYYSGNTEWLSFYYVPEGKNDNFMKGFSFFQYSKNLGKNNQKGKFDIDDYEKKVLSFLNQANVEKYNFYMIDSPKVVMPKGLDAETFKKVHSTLSKQRTETFGVVYKMTQKEALEFVTKISAGSKEYFKNNPSGFSAELMDIPTSENQRISLNEIVLRVINKPEFGDNSGDCSFSISVTPTFKNNIVTCDNYYVGIFRQKGYSKVIPTDWPYIKSSIYGQVEYRENPEDEKTDEVFEIEILE